MHGATVVLADDLRSAYAKELGEKAEVLGTFTGAQLEGMTYEPLFGYFAERAGEKVEGGEGNPGSEFKAGAFRVLCADYVTTADGTGVVHQAPAFGEDDMFTCEAAGIDLELSLIHI